MPLFHCSECHHEWEGGKNSVTCDWCGADGYVLADTTQFEIFIEDFLTGKFNKLTSLLVDRKSGATQ